MSISAVVLKKVKNTIEEYQMIKEGETVLVALSGGADSVCLTHVLSKLGNEMNFRICAAHLNHGIRGEEAKNDENFAKNFCRENGIKIFSKTVDVPYVAETEGLTVEEAGRKERYAFFNEVCPKNGKIATAHNRDDVAETVLMRIIRGTGIDGLTGIKFVREDNVIRPLLNVSRKEIEGYLKEAKIGFCTDSTNSDNNYTRNKIRNELIPYLEENFNPNISESLVNLSKNAVCDSEFLNSYAKRLYKSLGSPMPNRKPVVLHIESLEMVDKAIMSRLIMTATKEKMGEDFHLEKKHVEDILRLKNKETGAMMCFPKGLTVTVKYGWLEFKNENQTDIKDAERYFDKDYMVEIEPGNGYKIEGSEGTVYVKRVVLSEYKKSAGDILLDESKISAPIVLRNRRKGDFMAVFSDGRSKKIKSIFIDMKIPREKRDDIPLVCCGSEVLAIVGGRVSQRYRADKDTEIAWVIYYSNEEK